MFTKFFYHASRLHLIHQLIIALIVFLGISAIWWAGYVFFDEFFLPKLKIQYRVLFAFLLGLMILIGTRQVVNNLM